MDDFWSDFIEGWGSAPSSVDNHLSGDEIGGPKFSSLQDLTDRERSKKALPLPATAGQRVAFRCNIGSVLTVNHVPAVGTLGTVLMVRTAYGDTTSDADHVFVKWDDGTFEAVPHEFLRLAKVKAANSCRKTAFGLGDLSDFVMASDKTSDLIHKSTKDLWSFSKSDEGCTITRLFDDQGEPLKG